MTKRSAVSAIVVVTLGLIAGAGILSGMGEFTFSFAENAGRTFESKPLYTPTEDVTSLNEAFKKVAEIVTPQVVYINVTSKASERRFWPFGIPEQQQEQNFERGSGSGIIITEDGYIMTNNHVIEGATEGGITVTLNDSREFNATVVGADKNTDIAVIKIDATGLSAASLANSDDVKVGEWVLAVGNPLGLTSTVTAGIVSAISRNVNLNMDSYAIENFIQTDAAVNPGNSGGALVNLNGQVIGVNTAIATGGFNRNYIGYSFAVPINLAKTVANGIIKYGTFARGYIGISITTLDAKRAKALGLDTYSGVLVESTQPDGAGAEAGIEASDVILEVNGKPVRNASELQARVGMNAPGTVIKVKIFRNGEYHIKDVRLKGKNGETEVVAMKKDDSPVEKEESTDLGPVTFEKSGFTVENLDSRVKEQFKVDHGVVVTDVKRFSPAFDNNLQSGTVILEAKQGANVTKINNVSDLKKVLKDLNKDDAILLRIQDSSGRKGFVAIEGPVS